MKLPEYITKAEVKRVCKLLGLRDWSSLKKPEVKRQEAVKILKLVNTRKMPVPVESFQKGLEVELEHGTRYREANVTNNHPVLTGKIVLAHLNETLDYYERLEVAELEGDLLKAVKAKNLKKIGQKYRKLVAAQETLFGALARQIR